MGAAWFVTVGHGSTPEEAFEQIRAQTRYEEGRGGYTGTIAEKRTFKLLIPIEDIPLHTLIEWIVDPEATDIPVELRQQVLKLSAAVYDKWGPAGCFKTDTPKKYIFFGWAST